MSHTPTHTDADVALLRHAVELARRNRREGGQPFGAVIARGGQTLATGVNEIHRTHDPSTHAEMQALRAATRALGEPQLQDCDVYASGHPCPMCLAAIVMAGARQVFFAFDNADAAPWQLSSEASYRRLRLPLQPPPLPLTRLHTGIRAAQLYGDESWPAQG